MTFEFCIDSIDGAVAANKYGAKRVELCAALNVGGLTPSYGLIKQCSLQNIEVHVMIRHTEGGFVYSEQDIVMMEQDIEMAKEAGASGVVFGCLTEQNILDVDSNKRLIQTANNLGLAITFHRAFDLVSNPTDAVETLIDLRVDRILTSGQKDKAIDGIGTIEQLVKQADGRIEIMAGSGVNSSNAVTLSKTGIDALHFTINQPKNESESLGMGTRSVIDEEKITSILTLFEL